MWVLLLPILLACLGGVSAEPTGPSVPRVEYLDDFSNGTGMWVFWGCAYRDAENGWLVLTEPDERVVGGTWLGPPVDGPFTARFRYRAGGGGGADGFVFMFFKTQEYEPGGGGNMGFNPPAMLAPGYGVEFDNWINAGDPLAAGSHVALIEDSLDEHLVWVNDTRTGDYEWHQVEVRVGWESIEVDLDGDNLIAWRGHINRTFGGLGFSAATGALTDWHIIDDVNVSALACPGSYPELWEEVSGMFSSAKALIGDAEQAGMDTQALWDSYRLAEEARDACDYEAAWQHLEGILGTEIPEAIPASILFIAIGQGLGLGAWGSRKIRQTRCHRGP